MITYDFVAMVMYFTARVGCFALAFEFTQHVLNVRFTFLDIDTWHACNVRRPTRAVEIGFVCKILSFLIGGDMVCVFSFLHEGLAPC